MKTFLYQEHVSLGARMLDFNGWMLPLNYMSSLKEHEHVRAQAGLFDISHMARILVEGPDAEKFLNYLTTNCVDDLVDHKAQYTVLCNEEGMCVDDVIIIRHHANLFTVVVNAGNRENDLNFFKAYQNSFDVQLDPLFEGYGILAFQGPASEELLKNFYPSISNLKFMEALFVEDLKAQVFISKTGYTGETGYEIYGPEDQLLPLWKQLVSHSSQKVKPIGLAARDTLRLEMGYALYGHELFNNLSPLESLAAWTVKKKKSSFLGKQAIDALREQKQYKKTYAVVLSEPLIARPKMKVYIKGQPFGWVTSGGFSPSLKQSIALVLLDKPIDPNDSVSIEIRNRQIEAKIVGLPFYHKT